MVKPEPTFLPCLTSSTLSSPGSSFIGEVLSRPSVSSPGFSLTGEVSSVRSDSPMSSMAGSCMSRQTTRDEPVTLPLAQSAQKRPTPQSVLDKLDLAVAPAGQKKSPVRQLRHPDRHAIDLPPKIELYGMRPCTELPPVKCPGPECPRLTQWDNWLEIEDDMPGMDQGRQAHRDHQVTLDRSLDMTDEELDTMVLSSDIQCPMLKRNRQTAFRYTRFQRHTV